MLNERGKGTSAICDRDLPRGRWQRRHNEKPVNSAELLPQSVTARLSIIVISNEIEC